MYIILYLSAIVLANLTVAMFGPGVAVLNAFLFIGLDLTARDWLHDAWHNQGLLPKMAALIAAGSLLSWLLNRAAGPVALASFVAFAAAASVDALAYQLLGRYTRWLRVNGSNIPSAAVDSLIFPTLAFGRFLWPVVPANSSPRLPAACFGRSSCGDFCPLSACPGYIPGGRWNGWPALS